jgi:hypothetical protein
MSISSSDLESLDDSSQDDTTSNLKIEPIDEFYFYCIKCDEIYHKETCLTCDLCGEYFTCKKLNYNIRAGYCSYCCVRNILKYKEYLTNKKRKLLVCEHCVYEVIKKKDYDTLYYLTYSKFNPHLKKIKIKYVDKIDDNITKKIIDKNIEENKNFIKNINEWKHQNKEEIENLRTDNRKLRNMIEKYIEKEEKELEKIVSDNAIIDNLQKVEVQSFE